MSTAKRDLASIRVGALTFALLAATGRPSAQSGLPNPYRPVKGLADGAGSMVPGGDWARLPGGREMGPPASMHVDIDGESIWAFIRCDETNPVTLANGGRFGIDCLDKNGRIKNIDTIYKFNANGEVVKSFGAGMFIWPHGLHVDKEGNVWATDGASPEAVAMAAKAGGKVRSSGDQVQPGRQGADDARRGRSAGERSSVISSRRAPSPSPPTEIFSSPTATA